MKKKIDVNSVVSKVWETTSKFDIIKESNIVCKIESTADYIYPKLKVIKESEEGSIILISAPGAVGKTTFAKHFAKIKKGFYWDLSKIKLGDNSFLGTIADAHGSSNLSRFLESLKSGEVCLFLDAFDEAEIRSGLDGVTKFIEEVFNYCKESKRPNVICFSRSETAEFLHLKLLELTDEDEFSVYEIEYFDEEQAVNFIKREIELKGDNSPNIHRIPFRSAVDSIFKTIGNGMNSEKEIWSDTNIRSFIGYAPVLQTIAGYLHQQNYGEIEANFSSSGTVESGISVISDFIDQLLLREQLKLINPLKEELKDIDPQWNNWEQLFMPLEQLKILLKYVHNNQIEVFPEVELPKWLNQKYKESVTNFISNHPFLKIRQYSSAAFRDYSIAKLLLENGFTELTIEFLSTGDFATTQLLANFYHSCHNGTCLGEHVGYLYESASSRKQLDDGTLFTFIEKSEGELYNVEIVGPDGDISTNLKFECLLNEDNALVFERRLVNAELKIQNSNVIFGKSNGTIELSDINIDANKIIFRASECLINCYDSPSIMIANTVIEEASLFKVSKIGDEKLEVLWPNSQSYPWTAYHNEDLTGADCEDGTMERVYGLQRILSPFRKHKRKEFAKHSDYIEKIIVGNNEIRKQVFQLLIDKKVLLKEHSLNQFIINEENLQKIGVTWDNIKSLSANKEVIDFLKS